MRDWFRRFIAVDNSINEQTVMGIFWAIVALGTGIASIWLESFQVFVASLSASLLCFGLNWKHK
jgi:hypothetical protein